MHTLPTSTRRVHRLPPGGRPPRSPDAGVVPLVGWMLAATIVGVAVAALGWHVARALGPALVLPLASIAGGALARLGERCADAVVASIRGPSVE